MLGGRQSQMHASGQPRQILAQLGFGLGLVAFALEAGVAAVVFQTLAAAVIGAPKKKKKLVTQGSYKQFLE